MTKVIHQNKLCTNPLSNLKNEATILTANRRLAANWRERYDQEQRTLGKQTWLSCDALPLETWLERCWNETLDARIVLNDFQEELVWQQIIKNSTWGNALLRIDETAKSAQQAWRLIVGWGAERAFRETRTFRQSRCYCFPILGK